jgi:hypothetical protein
LYEVGEMGEKSGPFWEVWKYSQYYDPDKVIDTVDICEIMTRTQEAAIITIV